MPLGEYIGNAPITVTALRTAERRTARRYSIYKHPGNERLDYTKQKKLERVIAHDALLNTMQIEKVKVIENRHPELSTVISEILKEHDFVANADLIKQYDDATEKFVICEFISVFIELSEFNRISRT